MKAAQFKAALARLGLTAAAAGEMLGYKRRQLTRWGAGEAPVPKLVERVLRWLESGKITRGDLEGR